MDKKVLAIIVIGALHLTLMWFMRGSLKPEELAHGTGMMHPDAAPIEPNPYTAPKVLAADEQETNGGEKNFKKPVLAQAISKKPDLPARNAKLHRSRDMEMIAGRTDTVAPPVFQNTIIWVKRAEVQPVYQAERAAVIEPKIAPAANIAPIKKRRSFFKKAGPVIRKPYDWIKTLISKL